MYSKDDFDLIKDKLNDIEKKAKKYYQDNFEEPTKQEYDDVMMEIKKIYKR